MPTGGASANRFAVARSLHRVIIVVGVVDFLFTLLTLTAQLALGDGQGHTYVLLTLCSWSYLAAGVLAWWRRPGNSLGPLILVGGVCVQLSMLSSSTVPTVQTTGILFASAILSVMVHLLHAFPSGRLHGRVSTTTVVVGYAVSFVLQFPLYAFDVRAVGTQLYVANRPDLLALGNTVQNVVGGAVMLATAGVLLRRIAAARPGQRRVLVPLFGYGMVAVLFIPLAADVLLPLDVLSPAGLLYVEIAVVAGLPVAFVLAVLRGGFARTRELDELAFSLGAASVTRPAISGALALVLGDDSMELLFWVPGRSTYVDSTGRPATLPARGGRTWVDIELDGQQVGVLVFDPELNPDRDLVQTAGRMVAVGVDRERLTAALRASERSLQHSRQSVVQAADAERRSIAQDLHDGLQVQLVLLALEAQQLGRDRDESDPVRLRAVELRRKLDGVAGDLRSFVHGVMPSSLAERGLVVATEDLVDRLPLPARLQTSVKRELPQHIQSTAYFVIAECLDNVRRHAQARRAFVSIELGDDALRIDVADDGIGGASPAVGHGIRWIADRVDVLGGRMEIVSNAATGTRVSVEIPC